MTEVCALALYIEPSVTIGEAARMIDNLFNFDDDLMFSICNPGVNVDDTGLSFTIEFFDDGHFRNAKRIREKAAKLGFKEDWDEMNEWESE